MAFSANLLTGGKHRAFSANHWAQTTPNETKAWFNGILRQQTDRLLYSCSRGPHQQEYVYIYCRVAGCGFLVSFLRTPRKHYTKGRAMCLGSNSRRFATPVADVTE